MTPRRRLDARLEEDLPDALDRLAADLRGGGTVLGGLEVLARGSGPLAGDLTAVVDRVATGAGVAESLADWRRRRPLPAVAVAAGALEVAHSVGGGAAGPLEGMASGLRQGREVVEEAAALSAQARVSALVVGLAPLGSVAFSLVVDRRVAAALFGSTPGRVCLLLGLGLQALAWMWIRRICSERRVAGALESEVPLLAELLAMAIGAGLTPYLALRVAAASAPPRTAARCHQILAAAHRERLAGALEAEAAASPPLRPVLEILLASERLGVPVVSALARLAAEARGRARRQALARARTVPVRLLFPLVFLVLPAFMALTVVPVLLAGITT